MKRLYTAGRVPGHGRLRPPGHPRGHLLVGFHRRLPGGDGRRFPGYPGSRPQGTVRPDLLVQVQRAPGRAGGPAGRRRAAGGQEGAPGRADGRAAGDLDRHRPTAQVGGAGDAPSAKGPPAGRPAPGACGRRTTARCRHGAGTGAGRRPGRAVDGLGRDDVLRGAPRPPEPGRGFRETRCRRVDRQRVVLPGRCCSPWSTSS